MSIDADHLKIERAIKDFARAYQILERLQKEEAEKRPEVRLLPEKGDQKTGLIGEYWAIRYARSIFPNASVEFGEHKPGQVEFNGADRLEGKSLRRHPNSPTSGSNCFNWNEAEAVTDIRNKLDLD